MASEAMLKELQEILRVDYGRKLSVPEAAELANDLIGYFTFLINQKKYDNDDTLGNP